MRILLILVPLLLAGCRAPLTVQPFDARVTPVRSLAVLPVHHDEALVFEYANDQLKTLNRLAPGPLGSALSAAAGSVGRDAFNERFPFGAEDYAARVEKRLADGLRRAGFRVAVVDAGVIPGDADRRGGLLLRLPEAAWSGADAVLESYLEAGFVAASRGAPYRPTAWLTVRLVRADGRVLLSDRVMVNALTSDDGDVIALRGIRLPVPQRFRFADEAALLADEAGDEALRHAVDRAATETVFLVRGPWL